MYLKKIIMHGFKSFADRSVIEFKPGITGIVGPNGCGKSNINDAIRWVLGEQSAKSLRGSSMADVIFNGSEQRKAQSLAEVTLVFDNQDQYIECEYNEIEITRRLYRDGNEAEYFLNRQQCRLKDIVDLMMDTGLGRDSLSIISQGNIANFADAKPEDRRSYFEEAAGVAKYKKRKEEALRRLERTSENLSRIEDIVYELEKQLNPLKRQKEKAEQYLDYRQQLQEIEVSLIVHEVKKLKDEEEQLKKDIAAMEIEDAKLRNDELILGQKSEVAKQKMNDLDREVNQLQTDFMAAMQTVTNLNNQKTELDAKRQYAISQSDDDIVSKIETIKALIAETLAEYNDRVARYEKVKGEIIDLAGQKGNISDQITKNKSYIEKLNNDLQVTRLHKAQIEDSIENNSGYSSGVRTIVNAKNTISGYQGVLGELLEVEDKYQLAIDTALGNAGQFIVMANEQSARQAINYLKNNRAGRATFLPLDTIKGRSIPNDTMTVLKGLDGYLGTAMDFVNCQPKFKNVASFQLGNVIVADSLVNANELSHYTYAKYRVVSLEGDVVNVGGSMTGGAFRNSQNQSLAAKKKELEKATNEIAKMEGLLIRARQAANQLDNNFLEINNALLQKQISKGQLEEYIKQKRTKLEKQKAEYEELSHEKLEMAELRSEQSSLDLIEQINKAQASVDSITEAIQTKRQLRMTYVEENEGYDSQIRQIRSKILTTQKTLTAKQVDATRLEGQIANSLERLNEEYQMTFENAVEVARNDIDFSDAREQVLHLRSEISALGHVNLDAISQYDEVLQRYTELENQRVDLKQACDSIVEAIKEMDGVMETKFSETFEKINEEFNWVFRRLFGGGKAALRYSDPENILETGVDIDVQPPGKNVQNITLFSGGEKALIALSGLFAILRVRPVPMCLLDEVEAALDQANVERFAKFLRDFSKQTQFIVVTHRPGTMEECDALYGATMQESGVTRLISVQLKDAMDLAE